jgi:alkyldihydroxyacetonephosphate synthase
MAATGVDQLSGPLAQIVGEENVLTGANVARFSGDALGAARGSTQVAPVPAADVVVVRPGETQEVAAVVRIANERGIAIVPRGGGSGLMGGALPLTRAIVIDTTRMDRVLDVSRDDQTMLVQSGAVLGEVNRHLQPHSLVLGHDPWTVNVATVGGTISTDSLGYLGAKYGSMGDQVFGLTVVLPDGSLLETGAVAKASVGPDLRAALHRCGRLLRRHHGGAAARLSDPGRAVVARVPVRFVWRWAGGDSGDAHLRPGAGHPGVR